jgi:hypothetical protein
MSNEHGFVIKVTSPPDVAVWVGPVTDSRRAFGPRDHAELFPTRLSAHVALGEMPLAFDRAGFIFSIESAG